MLFMTVYVQIETSQRKNYAPGSLGRLDYCIRAACARISCALTLSSCFFPASQRCPPGRQGNDAPDARVRPR